MKGDERFRDLYFPSQNRCIEFCIEQEDPLEYISMMNKLYDHITVKYGTGKRFMGTPDYDRFMEAKHKLVLELLIKYKENGIGGKVK